MKTFRKFIDGVVIEWEHLRAKGENKENLEMYVGRKSREELMNGFSEDVRKFLSLSPEVRAEILEKYSGQNLDKPLDKIS